MRDVGTVQRAFELARTGEYRGVEEIERQLRAEGYAGILEHLNGQTIRRQLRSTIKGCQPPG